MFAEKKSNQSQSPQRNLIARGTEIKGDIISDGDFRIDGKVEGNVQTTGRLIIGKEGFIQGTIICANADIEGQISGKLTCSGTLSLKQTATIDGEVFIEKLAVEPGATFNAVCSMKGIKALNSEGKQPKSKKSAS